MVSQQTSDRLLWAGSLAICYKEQSVMYGCEYNSDPGNEILFGLDL